MDLEFLNTLEAKIKEATEYIESLTEKNNELLLDRNRVRALQDELNKLRTEKDLNIEKHLQREIAIKTKVQDIIDKLSVIKPRGE
jgi:FtsZ-binding cell division protein ZapB